MVSGVVKIEIKRIASEAKSTFDIPTRLCILKKKAFKIQVGDPQRGGAYRYFQDCVFINQSVVRSYSASHLEWMLFHEFGHAYVARIFAKHKFFPIVFYESIVDDNLMEHAVKTMWQGLSDYYVNELVLTKLGLKKIDLTLEHTIDDISQPLASGMCFRLYDYWKHGRNNEIAQKAKEKIPLSILNTLEQALSTIPLDNPIDRMINLFGAIIRELFKIDASVQAGSKKEIEENAKAKIPEFWGDDNTKLSIMVVTSKEKQNLEIC